MKNRNKKLVMVGVAINEECKDMAEEFISYSSSVEGLNYLFSFVSEAMIDKDDFLGNCVHFAFKDATVTVFLKDTAKLLRVTTDQASYMCPFEDNALLLKYVRKLLSLKGYEV